MKNKDAILALQKCDPEGEFLVYSEARDSGVPVESIEPAMVAKGDPPGAAVVYLKD